MDARIRVKFIGNYSAALWRRQFPQGRPSWGACDYLLDADATDYDWLVVYNDLPGERPVETLACDRRRTILVTMEPSSIKVYGRAFTAQFGYILTSQPEWALPHPRRIFSQSGLQWYYGAGKDRLLTYDQMAIGPPDRKDLLLSTVCSTKQQRHTLHHKRYSFTQALKERLPELDIYGYGVKPMDDKAEALDRYKYHLAIENYVGPHHWTEKLADVFLGAALPFYYGCPNAGDYFPAESFIPIDIDDVDGAAATIRAAIAAGQYEKRRAAILEARRLVMEEYNIFAVLEREIRRRKNLESTAKERRGTICARRVLRSKKPLAAIQDVFDKCYSRVLHTLKKSD